MSDQTGTTDLPAIIDDKTDNYDLPLPNVQNLMSLDCGRIRAALIQTDAELKKFETRLENTANEALPKSGGVMTGQITMTSANETPFVPGQVPEEQIMSYLTDYLLANSVLENGQGNRMNNSNLLIILDI